MKNDTNEVNIEVDIIVLPTKEPVVCTPIIKPVVLISLLTISMVVIGMIGYSSTEIGKCSILPLFMILYSRIKKVEVLDHYTRGHIMGYLRANPGMNFTSIKEELELNNGSLAFHLKVLEREGYITSKRVGKYKWFYPAKSKIKKPISIKEQVLATLRRNPGITQKQIAKKIGQNPASVHKVLHKLQKADIVEFERDGRKMKCYLIED